MAKKEDKDKEGAKSKGGKGRKSATKRGSSKGSPSKSPGKDRSSKKNKKNDKGKFVWKDGSNYEGTFNSNIIHGHGKYVWNDGRAYEGDWDNNTMSGRGTFTWDDGRKYEGDYYNDIKQGHGTFYWQDGRKYWSVPRQRSTGLCRGAHADLEVHRQGRARKMEHRSRRQQYRFPVVIRRWKIARARWCRVISRQCWRFWWWRQ